MRVWATGGLLALLAVSLALFARNHGAERGRATGISAPTPEDPTGLPEDHPTLGPPALFESRFEELGERLAADRDDPEALLAMARLLHDAHRPEEATGFYERYLEQMPDSAHVWLDLANAHGAAGAWEDAVQASLRLLERHPGHAGGLYNLGASYANLGRYSDARSAWETALETGDPDVVRRAESALARLREVR